MNYYQAKMDNTTNLLSMTLNNKVKELVVELNIIETQRFKDDGITCYFNEDGTLIDQEKVTAKEKKKYINIDFGGSGAFMIDKTDNQVYNIKGYGVPNKAKCYGSVFELDGKTLHGLRWDYRKSGRK